jgi:HPr kinase/phosphorylase
MGTHTTHNTPSTLHGVFLVIYQTGVLITGESGIGKSELGLNLIKRGHTLIADDIVEIRANDQGGIIGECPELLRDFIEVRGLGILNVRKMFGDTALAHQHSFDLIVKLEDFSATDTTDRINGMYSTQKLFAQSVPEVTILIKVGRDLAVLVETAVQNQQLRMQGYYANEDFKQKQQRYYS